MKITSTNDFAASTAIKGCVRRSLSPIASHISSYKLLSIHLALPLFNRTVHRLAHRPLQLNPIELPIVVLHRQSTYLGTHLRICQTRLHALQLRMFGPRHRQCSSRDKTPIIIKATSPIISEKDNSTSSPGGWTTSACAPQAEQLVLSAGASETRTPCVVVGYLGTYRGYVLRPMVRHCQRHTGWAAAIGPRQIHLSSSPPLALSKNVSTSSKVDRASGGL